MIVGYQVKMRLGLLVFFLATTMFAFCEPANAFIFKRHRQIYFPKAKAPVVQKAVAAAATVVDGIEEEWLCLHLVNQERERRKLPPLEFCSTLAEASNRWSSTMQRSGFRHGSGNEIIAMGGQSGAFAHRIWMNSPPHRAALLNPRYTKVGFGMVNGYWTGRFH